MMDIEQTTKIYWRNRESGIPEDVLRELYDLARTNCETEWYEWFAENDSRMYPALNDFLSNRNIGCCLIKL